MVLTPSTAEWVPARHSVAEGRREGSFEPDEEEAERNGDLSHDTTMEHAADEEEQEEEEEEAFEGYVDDDPGVERGKHAMANKATSLNNLVANFWDNTRSFLSSRAHHNSRQSESRRILREYNRLVLQSLLEANQKTYVDIQQGLLRDQGPASQPASDEDDDDNMRASPVECS